MLYNFVFPEEINTLIRLEQVLEKKYSFYQGHSQTTVDLVMGIARAMDLPDESTRNLVIATYLHDAGMLLLYPELLVSEQSMDHREKNEMLKGHCLFLEKILPNQKYQEVIHIIRGHHEWVNGKGYPDGLAGAAIPVEARIIAVIDGFTSLISRRAYREPVGMEEALVILSRKVGEQFDPEIFGILSGILLPNPVGPGASPAGPGANPIC